MYVVWLPESDEKPKVFDHLPDARKYANSEISGENAKGDMAHIYDVIARPAAAVQMVMDGKIPILEYIGRKATEQQIALHRGRAARTFLRKLGLLD